MLSITSPSPRAPSDDADTRAGSSTPRSSSSPSDASEARRSARLCRRKVAGCCWRRKNTHWANARKNRGAGGAGRHDQPSERNGRAAAPESCDRHVFGPRSFAVPMPSPPRRLR